MWPGIGTWGMMIAIVLFLNYNLKSYLRVIFKLDYSKMPLPLVSLIENQLTLTF
jgi:hypothetical protein